MSVGNLFTGIGRLHWRIHWRLEWPAFLALFAVGIPAAFLPPPQVDCLSLAPRTS